MSKYTPRSVLLLEGIDDFPLTIHIQSKCQTSYNHALYGAWMSSMLVPNVGTKFCFCGNSYMISKSYIDVSNLGLFILSHVFVPPKQLVSLMPFCGPLYGHFDYLNIVKYKHNISVYCMCMNGYACINFNRKNLLYTDGRPQTHGNIVGFINSSKSSLFSENCCFEEHSYGKEFFMKKKESIFVVVLVVHSLSLGEKLLINYNFRIPPTACQNNLHWVYL